MSEHNKTTQPLVTDEPKLSKHELKIYGFEHQPIVGNERIKAFANKYTAGDHESLVHHRNQSFKAGAWEVRAIYEKDRAALLRERDEATQYLTTILAMFDNDGCVYPAQSLEPDLKDEIVKFLSTQGSNTETTHPSPQSDTLI